MSVRGGGVSVCAWVWACGCAGEHRDFCVCTGACRCIYMQVCVCKCGEAQVNTYGMASLGVNVCAWALAGAPVNPGVPARVFLCVVGEGRMEFPAVPFQRACASPALLAK